MPKNRYTFTRRDPKTRSVENVGFLEIKNTEESGTELYIYGNIVSSEIYAWTEEATTPKGIIDFMEQIEDTENLTIYINSDGGDAFAGIAIYNILSRHSGHKKGIVDGIAASIASVILMACDEIAMSTGALLMMHKPSTAAFGNADDFAQAITLLDKCQQSITDAYMTRVKDGVTREQVTEKINNETWLNAEEAQELFNIEAVERPEAAACASKWCAGKFKHKPKHIKTLSAEDVNTAQEKAIIEEMELFGI